MDSMSSNNSSNFQLNNNQEEPVEDSRILLAPLSNWMSGDYWIDTVTLEDGRDLPNYLSYDCVEKAIYIVSDIPKNINNWDIKVTRVNLDTDVTEDTTFHICYSSLIDEATVEIDTDEVDRETLAKLDDNKLCHNYLINNENEKISLFTKYALLGDVQSIGGLINRGDNICLEDLTNAMSAISFDDKSLDGILFLLLNANKNIIESLPDEQVVNFLSNKKINLQKRPAKYRTIVNYIFTNLEDFRKDKISTLLQLICHKQQTAVLYPYMSKLIQNIVQKEKLLNKNILIYIIQIMHMCLDDSKYSNDCINSYNSNFIKLVFMAINSDDVALANNAKLLYKKYLQLPEIQQLLQKEDVLTFFGNLYGEILWDATSYNYLFLQDDLMLLLSTEQFKKFFDTEDKYDLIEWNKIYLFDLQGKYKKPSEYILKDIFTKHFVIFKNNFIRYNKNYKLKNLLKSLTLGEYEEIFISTLKYSSSSIKLINELDYKTDAVLTSILMTNINYSTNVDSDGITTEHLASIKTTFNLEEKSNEEISQYLICIAYIFIKYSSKSMFGAEADSLTSLRVYARALLQEAYKLNSDNNYIQSYTASLVKDECSDSLSYDILIAIKNSCSNNVIRDVIPQAWL